MKLLLLLFISIAQASFLEPKIVKKYEVEVISKKNLANKRFMSKFAEDKRDKFFISGEGKFVDLIPLKVKEGPQLLSTFGASKIHQALIGFIANKGFKKTIKWTPLSKYKSKVPCLVAQKGYESKTLRYSSENKRFNYFYEVHTSTGKKEGCLEAAKKEFLHLAETGKCTLIQSTHTNCIGEMTSGIHSLGGPLGVLSYKAQDILIIDSNKKGLLAFYFSNNTVSKMLFEKF